jgi:hypothetical protein
MMQGEKCIDNSRCSCAYALAVLRREAVWLRPGWRENVGVRLQVPGLDKWDRPLQWSCNRDIENGCTEYNEYPQRMVNLMNEVMVWG